jgi:hypothetical protein
LGWFSGNFAFVGFGFLVVSSASFWVSYWVLFLWGGGGVLVLDFGVSSGSFWVIRVFGGFFGEGSFLVGWFLLDFGFIGFYWVSLFLAFPCSLGIERLQVRIGDCGGFFHTREEGQIVCVVALQGFCVPWSLLADGRRACGKSKFIAIRLRRKKEGRGEQWMLCGISEV